MNHYKPTRLRWGQVLARFIRGIAGLLERWPLFLLAVVIVSPIGPHVRWQYTYEQRGSDRFMLNCEYFGSRGFVKHVKVGRCPVFVIIDTRKNN
ncbi:MAG: hypothetical protein KZQ85_08750 [Candidatus Thiodiazotropha sp. (ex Myrtea sp. 'scaly one' KF741663)]|nr:hypothetical protein [Candidatus Thiodiazotropha sp. (ex Myrtea sp. 'scaly one' KF741663)]